MASAIANRREAPNGDTTMMTRSELNAALCAVLTTLLETPGHTCPNSVVYMALGMSITSWELVSSAMAKGELATITMETITLTPKGIEMANAANAFLKAVKK